MAYLDENGLEYFWGKIKDRVSSAVAPKANDADVVHKTGDETVEGVKVFSNAHATDPVSQPNLRASSVIIKSPDLVRGVIPEHRRYVNLQLVDSTGTDVGQTGRLGSMEYQAPHLDGDGRYGVYIRSWKYLPADALNPSTGTALFVGYDKDEIPYSTAPATSDDRTDPADIVTRGFMEASEWNWQKTQKAGAVAFKPVLESDLEPVVDFMFTETPPAEGDKGPDNPSTITGVSSAKVTRCGKNLIKYPYDAGSSYTYHGYTATSNNDGSVSLNGESDGLGSMHYCLIDNYDFILKKGVSYSISLSGNVSSQEIYLQAYNSYGTIIFTAYAGGGGTNTTLTPAEDMNVSVRISVTKNAGNLTDVVVYPQIETGTAVTAFEPYAGNNYTIQFGDTYYGGSLDVATGVMTVTHYGMIFNGTESFIERDHSTYYRYRLVPNILLPASGLDNQICSHFIAEGNLNTTSQHFVIAADGTLHFITTQTTLAAFVDWVVSQYQSGTPLTVAYKLATPFTVQLTPTQIRSLPALDKYEPRINTVYSDQEAVQVGYQRYVAEDNLVHKYGAETISGAKTFSSSVRINNALTLNRYSNGPQITFIPPTEINDGYHRGAMMFPISHRIADGVSGNRLFNIGCYDVTVNGNRLAGLYPYDKNDDISEGLIVGILDVLGNSVPYASAPSTPEYDADGTTLRTNGTDIVTRNWIPKDTRIVHTTGNENIDGVKTFIAEPHILKNGQSMIYFESVNAGYIATCGIGQSKALGFYNNTNGKWIFRWYPSAGNFEISAVTTGTAKVLAGDVGGTLQWNGQTIQTTSDERLKTPLLEVPDAVLDAWEDVNWGQFQYLDAVNEKGNSARLHLGLIAQHVVAVFERHGLDACAYGILCHEERPAVDEEETVTDVEAYVDGEGVEHPAVTHVETRHEDAVDLWMVRYAEAQAMEAACLRRANARLKARLDALEERLAALEMK